MRLDDEIMRLSVDGLNDGKISLRGFHQMVRRRRRPLAGSRNGSRPHGLQGDVVSLARRSRHRDRHQIRRREMLLVMVVGGLVVVLLLLLL